MAFGSVAALYDEARPPFPDAALDALMAGAGLTSGSHVLEVGAGTGKATAALAARGLTITALEPSAEMAALARHNCDGWPVEVLETEFEHFSGPAPYAAVICANAWHWIDHATRYRHAHDALAPGGSLAALWLFPDWSRCALREPLAEVYRVTVPELAPEFPMHPRSEPTRLAGDWRVETLGNDLFVAPQTVTIASELVLSAEAYIDLLCTHQDHILLGTERREALLTGVAATIDRTGAIALPTITYACVARRC
ncbi:MAG: class I SAM-dependent methyltransferase [Solirubrobacteraceae bacterium]